MAVTLIGATLCLVVAVADGDTLKVRCGEPGHFDLVTIRLAEIDAPEKRQAFGNRSKLTLSELCFDQWAKIAPLTRDRYGRTVARVRCQGLDSNAEQVRTGMAWAFTRYLTDPEIARLEAAAREVGVGLWRDADAVAPWDWTARRLGRPHASLRHADKVANSLS